MQLSIPTFNEPAAAGRQAQLVLALLLAALLPVFLITLPVRTHAVKIDLPPLPDAVMPMPPAPSPPAYALTTIILPDLDLEPSRPLHELVVTPDDKVLWNGREVDMRGLHARLLLAEAREEWVAFRPDAKARYEAFAEVLAATRRARLERMRLDSRPFRAAIDGGPEPLQVRARR